MEDFEKDYGNGYIAKTYYEEDFDNLKINKNNIITIEKDILKDYLLDADSSYTLFHKDKVLCIYGTIQTYIFLITSEYLENEEYKIAISKIAKEELKRMKGDFEYLYTFSQDTPYNEYLQSLIGMVKTDNVEEVDGIQQRIWFYK